MINYFLCFVFCFVFCLVFVNSFITPKCLLVPLEIESFPGFNDSALIPIKHLKKQNLNQTFIKNK